MRKYGLPKKIWENCLYQYKGNFYLDMSSNYWCNLEITKQQEYAAQYQYGFASEVGNSIEKTIKTKNIEIKFCLIPPGRFWMGSPEDEKGHMEHEKRHKVLISNYFYIGKYEITQGQWKKVMGNNPSYFNKNSLNAPVEWISWNDSRLFCDKLNFKLPTEAQWEYACRAGTTGAFNIDEISLKTINYYSEVDRQITNEVGSLKNKNAWGGYDFHGNLWEWCFDWYSKNYYNKSPDTNPKGPNHGFLHPFRGGSWIFDLRFCRSAMRFANVAETRDSDIGLRVVLEEL